jgi:site-specific recombinase XerD
VPVTSPEYRRGKAPPNKGQRYPVEILSREEFRRLLASFGTSKPVDVRNRALLGVLYGSGLRIGETLALLPKDLGLDIGTINVRRGKGAKQRIVAIDRGGLDLVETWLDRRFELELGDRVALFCTLRPGISWGRQVHDAYVRDMLKERAAMAGITKRVHPHALRHSCAAELSMHERWPVDMIRRQLGHRDLRTTQRYIDHIAPGDLVAAMSKRNWAA